MLAGEVGGGTGGGVAEGANRKLSAKPIRALAHSHIFTAKYQTEWLQFFQMDAREEE